MEAHRRAVIARGGWGSQEYSRPATLHGDGTRVAKHSPGFPAMHGIPSLSDSLQICLFLQALETAQPESRRIPCKPPVSLAESEAYAGAQDVVAHDPFSEEML